MQACCLVRLVSKRYQHRVRIVPRSLTTGLFSIFFVRPAKLGKGSTRWSPRKHQNVLKGIEGILAKLDTGSEVNNQEAHGCATQGVL